MHSYILPTIVSLPLGYDVDIPLVENDIIGRLAVGDTTIKVRVASQEHMHLIRTDPPAPRETGGKWSRCRFRQKELAGR